MSSRRMVGFVALGLVAAYLLPNVPVIGNLSRLGLVVRWLGLAAAAAVLYPRRSDMPSDTTSKLGVLFLGLAGGSVFWAVSRQTTVLKTIGLGLLFVALYLVADVYPPDGIGRAVSNLLGGLNGALIVATVLVVATVPSRAFDTGRLQGPFGNPNGLGVALALTMPGLWAMSVSTRTKRLLRNGAVAAGIVMIVLSGSRTALVAVAVEAAVVLAVVGKRRLYQALYGLALVAALLALAGHLGTVTDWFVQDLVYKGTGGLLETRAETLAASYEAALQRPILGHGFGNQADPPRSGIGIVVTTVGSREVGNSYLGLIEQLGVVGLALALALLAALGRDVLDARWRLDPMHWAVVAGVLLGGLAAAMFEAFLFAPGSLEALVVWGVAAVAHAVAVRARSVVVWS